MADLKTPDLSSPALIQSRLSRIDQDQITAHCKRDHLHPSYHQNISSTNYHHSFTPNKKLINYNLPELEKGMLKFRKHQNSTSLLPTIPSILEHSHYRNQYAVHSVQKIQRGHQKESFFMKLNWALDPSSNYQKDFIEKNGTKFNKVNASRSDHNQIHILNVQQGNKRVSNYTNDFKVISIKKQAELDIAKKDKRLKENTKIDMGISEYQRRYDSLMEDIKPKKSSLLNLYKKEQKIPRPHKTKI